MTSLFLVLLAANVCSIFGGTLRLISVHRKNKRQQRQKMAEEFLREFKAALDLLKMWGDF